MVTKTDTVFKLFANCHVIDGASRSVICDLKGKVFIIPPKFVDFIPLLKDINGIACGQIDNIDTLKEFVDELEFKQMGKYFNKDILGSFPSIESKWNSPYAITNAVIDFDDTHTYNWAKFIVDLDGLNCPFIQIRVFNKASFNHLNSCLKLIDNTEIYSVQLIIPFDDDDNFGVELSSLIDSYPRIADLIIYNCSSDYLLSTKYAGRVRVTNETVTNSDSCGIINSSFFTLKVDNFYESHLYNSCLNRKVSITNDGLIKNCPSMRDDYGKIDDVNLSDIIKSDKFQFWWTIKKDDIEVCKDCEFRYICSDCRAFTSNISNPYSKPSKCPYDPYTCTGF